ncbi:MAG: lamin tail domain-containing protein [Kiritimatiellae bacterium]|nr:lamin tail domain-containing protein [Kiritimatiellia bacterium]MDD4341929.1 lamin tail domain-containing protein [Kiritimatiellia bacterium]
MKKWIIGLASICLGASMAAGQLIISQYVDTDSGTTPKGLELWNAGGSEIDFSVTGLDILKGVNGGALSSDFTLDAGTLAAGAVMVVGTQDIVDYVEGLGTGVLTALKAFTFNGDDALQVQLDSVVQDTFGTPGVDPGSAWSGSGVSTADQNIQLLDGISTGSTAGWTDPSTRFETISETPSAAGGLEGFGVAPGPVGFAVSFDQADAFTVEEGSSATITATAANGTEPYAYAWTTDLGETYRTISGGTLTILATAPIGSYSASVVATDGASATASNSLTFSVAAPAVKYAITVSPSVNGSATTTPATEAEAGTTVTVNPTPDSGYAKDTITVTAADTSNVEVTGETFTMPAQAVTVAVTFQEASTSGALIISQYYEGPSYNKWIEIYNPGSAAVDLSAGSYYVGSWNNDNREGWKTDAAPSKSVALTGTIAGGGTYLVNESRAALPTYATADQSFTPDFNGDDSVVLYTGETYAFANVVDAFGLTGNTAKDKSFVRKDTVTVGVNTDFNAADWDEFTNAEVDAAAESTNERIGYHSTGPAVFSVSFDQTSGFTVEEGSSATITATAANGTEPYAYAWTTDLGETYRTISGGTLTILATAPIGSYSASVVATDGASATASNSLTFSVVAPTPAEGIVDFRFNEDPYLQVTAKDANLTVSDMALSDGTIETAVTTGDYFTDEPYIEETSGWTATAQADAKAFVFTITPAAGASMTIDAISFKAYATSAGPSAFGFDIAGGTATYEVDAPSSTLVTVSQAVAGVVSETGAIEVKIQGWQNGSRESSGGGIFRLDDVVIHGSVSTGPLQFSVSVDKPNDFEVQEGNSATITATAANGTAPYSYSWTSTLGGAYFTDVDDVFTILATAPTGDYSATVTATDDTMATAQKTVTFSVVGLPPGQPAVLISGDMSGTVGVPLSLNISITNETASDWGFEFFNPDTSANFDADYSSFPPVWAFTPATNGTYTLTVTATTGSGDYSSTVYLVISAGSGGDDVPIPAITFVAGTGFTFDIPDGSGLARVEGANATVTGQEFTWTTLTSPTDYEVVGTTVTIKSGVATQRLIRVWFN